MQVKVSDIPAEGMKVQLTEDAGSLEGLVADIRIAGPVSAQLALKVIGTTVYLTGKVAGTVALSCSRCGREYTQDVDADIRLDLNPVESLGGEDEKELSDADLDVEFYSGGVIDLTGFVAEQLALGIPMKPLCGEDCKGVCQSCGKDLNDGECGCEAQVGHIGLAGLKELLDGMNTEEEGEGENG